MLGAVSFWRGFVVCRYTWLACVYIEGSRLKAILFAFGVTRVVSQHGCVGPYPRQAQSLAQLLEERALPSLEHPCRFTDAPCLFYQLPAGSPPLSEDKCVSFTAARCRLRRTGCERAFFSAAFSLTLVAGHGPAAPSRAPAPGAARPRRLIKAQRF